MTPSALAVLAALALPEVRQRQPAHLKRVLPCRADRDALRAAVREIVGDMAALRMTALRCPRGCGDTTEMLTLAEECARHRLPMTEIDPRLAAIEALAVVRP